MAASYPCAAGSFTFDAIDSGRYLSNGVQNFDLAGNFGTGWFGGVPTEIRSYFSFGLAGASGTITAATLRLEANPNGGNLLISPDGLETLTIFDVSTGLASLVASSAGVAGFTDLGTGTQYGSVSITFASPNTIDITFNANGLAYLNSLAGGTAVLGGAVTTLTSGSANEIVFNGAASGQKRQLLVTTSDSAVVPEPASIALVALGLAGLGLLRRRGTDPEVFVDK